ncbi:response regulator transcription factor [Mucilaginibacter sp. CSA2-8R]|uniref:response regulator transcription factor n=1 Tax=Mucilaginibacter sp. CSA2-8R TaxID=3141542 RepID=UPI00315CCCF8
MSKNISIGIVEDQFLFREGIKSILNSWSNFEVMFESSDGFSVIGKLDSAVNLPDLLLVDLSLPPLGKKEYSGLHLTKELAEKFPNIKVLVLSVHNDENYMAELIKNGAHGYLSKDCDPQELYRAIVNIHESGSYINSTVLKAIHDSMGKKARTTKSLMSFLSPREEEVLKLTCQQYTAEEIAEKLFISVKTVNGHRNSLLLKTGSRNVTGLVLFAIRNQIVQL